MVLHRNETISILYQNIKLNTYKGSNINKLIRNMSAEGETTISNIKLTENRKLSEEELKQINESDSLNKETDPPPAAEAGATSPPPLPPPPPLSMLPPTSLLPLPPPPLPHQIISAGTKRKGRKKKQLPLLDDCKLDVLLNFFKKIYGILSLQFMFIFGLFIVAMYVPAYREFVFNNGIFYLFCLSLTAVLIIILYKLKSLKYKYPLNIILLVILTFTMGYSLSMLGATDEPYEAYGSLVTIVIYLLLMTLFASCTYQKFVISTQMMLYAAIAIITFSAIATVTNTNISTLLVSMAITFLMIILISAYIQQIIITEYTEADIIPATISVYTVIIAFIANIGNAIQEYMSEHCCCGSK